MTHYSSRIGYKCRLMLTLVVLKSYLLNKVTWRRETERCTLVWCDLRSHLWLTVRKSFNICRLVHAQTWNSHTQRKAMQSVANAKEPDRRPDRWKRERYDICMKCMLERVLGTTVVLAEQFGAMIPALRNSRGSHGGGKWGSVWLTAGEMVLSFHSSSKNGQKKAQTRELQKVENESLQVTAYPKNWQTNILFVERLDQMEC